ncbi:hypothetical protein SM11_pC1005 (plasmid) [Sinorhizobium meliloti SM11]|uniref:Uncharacterized protein n=1 Tax=Sinorhizobium meliloti (strain SM11) TaxID=707241 RepID=F7XEV3_SINMM|nr:hypothetical protein SM11_pC1005 [Sinorhizobium meliloti SM11]
MKLPGPNVVSLTPNGQRPYRSTAQGAKRGQLR